MSIVDLIQSQTNCLGKPFCGYDFKESGLQPTQQRHLHIHVYYYAIHSNHK